jgi:hypothetical protein
VSAHAFVHKYNCECLARAVVTSRLFQYHIKALISVSFALSGDANYMKHYYLNLEILDFRQNICSRL